MLGVDELGSVKEVDIPDEKCIDPKTEAPDAILGKSELEKDIEAPIYTGVPIAHIVPDVRAESIVCKDCDGVYKEAEDNVAALAKKAVPNKDPPQVLHKATGKADKEDDAESANGVAELINGKDEGK